MMTYMICELVQRMCKFGDIEMSNLIPVTELNMLMYGMYRVLSSCSMFIASEQISHVMISFFALTVRCIHTRCTLKRSAFFT